MAGGRLALAFCLVVAFSCVCGSVKLTSESESIAVATKNGYMLADTETTLLDVPAGKPGYLTEQWFTSSPSQNNMNENTRIRIYVDNETVPSIDFMLLWGHGIGCAESIATQQGPWGTRRIGHEADGGIYNTYRIPFGRSIRVTAQNPGAGFYWYIGRGLRNVPLVVGEFELPSNTRLKLYKTEGQTLAPLEYLTAVTTPAEDTSGWLYMITFGGSSTDLTYLEGCFRAEVDDKPMQFLSSGTEDLFLSASYFNKGFFHDNHAGLTCFDEKGGTMSAYKFFEEDPVLFSKSLKLSWRNGEWPYHGEAPGACPITYEQNPGPTYRLSRSMNDTVNALPPVVIYHEAAITMYVWVYEYPRQT